MASTDFFLLLTKNEPKLRFPHLAHHAVLLAHPAFDGGHYDADAGVQEKAVVNPVPREAQYQSEVISHDRGIMTRDAAIGPIVQARLLWEKGASTMGLDCAGTTGTYVAVGART